MIEHIPEWFVVLSLVLLGLAGGSFAGAQVWRLRLEQLRLDKKRHQELKKQSKLSTSEKEELAELTAEGAERNKQLRRLKSISTKKLSDDRSRCLDCGHKLALLDLLPLVSWLRTGGKCRYCKSKIGYFEPLIELGLATFFVASFYLWPFELDTWQAVAMFVAWVLAGVPLAILLSYDAKWFLLPDRPMAVFISLAAIFAGLRLSLIGFSLDALLSLAGSIAAIGGLYWLLHAMSRGRWVGYGDVTLGAGLGLLLGDWKLAVVAVFLANLIGTIIILPGLLRGALKRSSQLPFGPLLIIGALLAFFFGQQIIDWYIGLI